MSWHVLAPISLCAWVYASALRERRYDDLVVAIGSWFAELSAVSQRRLALAAFALAATGHLALRVWLGWV